MAAPRPIRTTGDYPPEVIKTAEQTFASVADSLASQSDPKRRAVGLYAQLVVAMRRAGEAEQQRAGECADEPCARRRWKVAQDAARPHAQELARVAVAGQDPVVYAMALFGCRLNRDEGACAQVSAAGWAQLEPANAVPWFYRAGDAADRKDEAGVSEALLGAAHAQTSDSHGSTVLAMAEHPAARGLAAAPRLVYLSQLLGVYAALPTPPYVAVDQACGAERMADPARRKVCLDLATMMTERSQWLLELSLGTAIGERGGWPPDRVRHLRDEKDAMTFVGQLDWVAEDVHSCRFLEQLEVRVTELATLGELPAARRKVATSDRSVAALAEGWRELQRQRASAAGAEADPKPASGGK